MKNWMIEFQVFKTRKAFSGEFTPALFLQALIIIRQLPNFRFRQLLRD